jgi:hypothetical protein
MLFKTIRCIILDILSPYRLLRMEGTGREGKGMDRNGYHTTNRTPQSIEELSRAIITTVCGSTEGGHDSCIKSPCCKRAKTMVS